MQSVWFHNSRLPYSAALVAAVNRSLFADRSLQKSAYVGFVGSNVVPSHAGRRVQEILCYIVSDRAQPLKEKSRLTGAKNMRLPLVYRHIDPQLVSNLERTRLVEDPVNA